jgi:squalene-hopene/tetraprenyl-beta-curcumene cyclase
VTVLATIDVPARRVVLAMPRTTDAAEQLARTTLVWLLGQWQHDFVEALHTLPFPREQGFRGPLWVHSGDVFARAVIADALCDAQEIAGGVLTPIVNDQCDVLLSRKRSGAAGGWSYFPDLPELPPDADDLAQILTVLLRTGRREDAAAHCELPLRMLLRDCAHADGSFETWIIPGADRGPDEELQAQWAAKAWGLGADAEVVANLLHALSMYDPTRFRDVIARGAAWLATQQQADGSWQSSWYDGPFYGTWVATRFLAGRDDAAVARALAFIREQRHNGAWGDPLRTALAMLTLIAAGQITEAAASLDALAARRQADGGWESAPFIRMELGRATGSVHQILEYGSRCVTAAFVLKATTAIARAGAAHGHYRSDQ